MTRMLLLCAASLGLLACGGPTQVKGRIVDPSGVAIERAEIQTEPETDLILSNNKGFFIIKHRNDLNSQDALPIPEGEYTLKVIKEGFEDLAYDFEVKGGMNDLKEIVMKKKELNIGEAAPEAMGEKKITHGGTSTPVSGL